MSIIPIPPALIPLGTTRVRMSSVAPATTAPTPAATVAVMAAPSSPVSPVPPPAVLVVVLPVAARPFNGNVRLGGGGEGSIVGEVSEISIFESEVQCEGASAKIPVRKCQVSVQIMSCYKVYTVVATLNTPK